jgi:hypothetical protein
MLIGVAISLINLRSVRKSKVILATSTLDIPARKIRVALNQMPSGV